MTRASIRRGRGAEFKPVKLGGVRDAGTSEGGSNWGGKPKEEQGEELYLC